MRDYNLADVIRRRAAGQTWAEIGSAYGRSKASASSWWQANKPADAPKRRASRTANMQTPAEPTPTPESTPTPEPIDASTTSDPFEEPVRAATVDAGPQADGTPGATTGDVASTLGEDAARAYLPLFFGTMDAIAGAGAVWIVRRKLGDRATKELLDQARFLASLQDAEKQALESALVKKLATIELTPNEALLFTVLAIYAAKALAVSTLDVEPESKVLDSPAPLQAA